LALKGKKVLVVDLDPQAHPTTSLGVKEYELEKSIYEVFKRTVQINDAIIDLGRGAKMGSASVFAFAFGQAGSGKKMYNKEVLKCLKRHYFCLLFCF